MTPTVSAVVLTHKLIYNQIDDTVGRFSVVNSFSVFYFLGRNINGAVAEALVANISNSNIGHFSNQFPVNFDSIQEGGGTQVFVMIMNQPQRVIHG